MPRSELAILHTQDGKDSEEWETVPDRDKTAFLREQYWIKKTENHFLSERDFICANLGQNMPRVLFNKRTNDPGDGLFYKLSVGSQGVKSGIGWVEVVEVFGHNNAAKIDEVMRQLNDIRSARQLQIDVHNFERSVDLTTPSRMLQRRMADKVIERIKIKLNKHSYQEIQRNYGKGCLVVGLPLWFATPPANPYRLENVLDNFYVRLAVGLIIVQRKILNKKNCPFEKIVVVWENTREGLMHWGTTCDQNAYSDPTELSIKNPITFFSAVSVYLEYFSDTGPGNCTATLYVQNKAAQKSKKRFKSDQALIPEWVVAQEEMAKKIEATIQEISLIRKIKIKAGLLFIQIYLFAKVQGLTGLKKWFYSKFHIARYLQRRLMLRRIKKMYQKSLRKSNKNGGLSIRAQPR